jgi:hypothetical protein
MLLRFCWRGRMKRHAVRGKKNLSEGQKDRKTKLDVIREIISRRKTGLLRENGISEIDFAIQVSQLQEQITGLIELMTMAKLALARLLTDDDGTVSVDYARSEDE